MSLDRQFFDRRRSVGRSVGRRAVLGVAASTAAMAVGGGLTATARAGARTGANAGAGAGAGEGRPVRRTDLRVESDPGVRINVRELTASSASGIPVLLVHGARPDGLAAFDLPVPGGSFAADLVRAGHPAYVMDVRGYGRSTYPPEMSADPGLSDPLVRSDEAVRDVAAAVELVRRRSRRDRIAALGWATGGHWLGMYAAQRPDRVEALIVLNSLYSGTGPWALQKELEDPDNPGHPAPMPGWRAVTADSLTGRWDEQPALPDPVVREAYRQEAIAADPTSGTRNPPSFRNPTGPLFDAFYVAQGRQFWDASLVDSRVLVVRAEADFWSRPEDAENLAAHAPNGRLVTIPGATHYVHLGRPDQGRDLLLKEATPFLASK